MRYPKKIRPVRPDDLEALIALYISCFREPPWYEVFTSDEVRTDFMEILSWPETVFLVIENGDGKPFGAAIGFGVHRKPDVRDLLPHKMHVSFYLAEVFVDPTAREHGSCQWLLRVLSATAAANGYRNISARTSVNQPIIRHVMVDKLGCVIVGTEEVVSRKCVDGVIIDAADTRILMVGGTQPFNDMPARGCHSDY